MDAEKSKNSVKALPARLANPACFFLLQLFNASLVIPNGIQLSAEHDRREYGEEQRFETEK